MVALHMSIGEAVEPYFNELNGSKVNSCRTRNLIVIDAQSHETSLASLKVSCIYFGLSRVVKTQLHFVFLQRKLLNVYINRAQCQQTTNSQASSSPGSPKSAALTKPR